jgi:hypothetical protein
MVPIGYYKEKMEKKLQVISNSKDAHWSGCFFFLQNAPSFVEDRFHLNNVPSKDFEQILPMLFT